MLRLSLFVSAVCLVCLGSIGYTQVANLDSRFVGFAIGAANRQWQCKVPPPLCAVRHGHCGTGDNRKLTFSGNNFVEWVYVSCDWAPDYDCTSLPTKNTCMQWSAYQSSNCSDEGPLCTYTMEVSTCQYPTWP